MVEIVMSPTFTNAVSVDSFPNIRLVWRTSVVESALIEIPKGAALVVWFPSTFLAPDRVVVTCTPIPSPINAAMVE